MRRKFWTSCFPTPYWSWTFFPPSNIWPTLNSFQVEWQTNKRIPKLKLSGHYKYLLLIWPGQKASGERHSNPFTSFHQKSLFRFDNLLQRSQNLGKYLYELVYYKGYDKWTAWWQMDSLMKRYTGQSLEEPQVQELLFPWSWEVPLSEPLWLGFLWRLHYKGMTDSTLGISHWWLTSKKPSSCPGDQG